MKSNLFVFATLLSTSAFNYATDAVVSSFLSPEIRAYCIDAKTPHCEELAIILKTAQKRLQETGTFNWLDGEQEKCIELSDLIKKEIEEAKEKLSKDAMSTTESNTEEPIQK